METIYDPRAEPEEFVEHTLNKVKKKNSKLGNFYDKIFTSLYDINSSFYEDNFEVLEDKIDGYFRREIKDNFPGLNKSLINIRKINPNVETMKSYYVHVLAEIYLYSFTDEKFPDYYKSQKPIFKLYNDLKDAYFN